MTYTISKDFHFSASHQLDGLPEHHPCGRVHGHNYVVRLEILAPEVDRVGFVLDYGELKPLRRYVDDVLDHKHLNDVLLFNPTSENLARWLWRRSVSWFADLLPQGSTLRVAVSETPKTWAMYEGAAK